MSKRLFQFRYAPWFKKVLGVPVDEPEQPGEVMGRETADGYTILDTDKLADSTRFQQLKAKLEDSLLPRNRVVEPKPKPD